MNTSLNSELNRRDGELRTLLVHMLSLKAPTGQPLICAELMFQQMLDDYEAQVGWSATSRGLTPADLFMFARGEGREGHVSHDRGLFCTLHNYYRRLVCGVGQPDWLCGRGGPPELLHPEFPVYLTDREGGLDYVFSIKSLPSASQIETPQRSRPDSK